MFNEFHSAQTYAPMHKFCACYNIYKISPVKLLLKNGSIFLKYPWKTVYRANLCNLSAQMYTSYFRRGMEYVFVFNRESVKTPKIRDILYLMDLSSGTT